MVANGRFPMVGLLRGCIDTARILAPPSSLAYCVQLRGGTFSHPWGMGPHACKGEGDGPPPVARRGRGQGFYERKRNDHD